MQCRVLPGSHGISQGNRYLSLPRKPSGFAFFRACRAVAWEDWIFCGKISYFGIRVIHAIRGYQNNVSASRRTNTRAACAPPHTKQNDVLFWATTYLLAGLAEATILLKCLSLLT